MAFNRSVLSLNILCAMFLLGQHSRQKNGWEDIKLTMLQNDNTLNVIKKNIHADILKKSRKILRKSQNY